MLSEDVCSIPPERRWSVKALLTVVEGRNADQREGAVSDRATIHDGAVGHRALPLSN